MKLQWVLFGFLVWALPAVAQAPIRPPLPRPQLNLAVDERASAEIRQEVARSLRLPDLDADATVFIRATVLLSGAIVDPDVRIYGVEGEQETRLRRSIEEAIGRTVGSTVPGRVEFWVTARTRPWDERCLPLRVYIPDAMEDSPEPVPPSTVAALRQGVERWNRLVALAAEHGTAAAPAAPFVLVDDPEQADVRVQTYEDYGENAVYLVNEQSNQAVLHVPLKRLRGGVAISGSQWSPPEVVTQQTMLQLGRLFGVAPAGAPPTADPCIAVASTGLASDLHDAAQFRALVSSAQLDAALKNLRTRTCGSGSTAASDAR
jgi:hypothetical protein